VQQIMALPPGWARLSHIGEIQPIPAALDADDANFLARLEETLSEAAVDGAILIEVRLGNETFLRPNCMALFREAEQRVQTSYPRFRAEAIVTLILSYPPARLEQMVQACLQAAGATLYEVDFLYSPYNIETEWTTAYHIAERLATAGLGITVHAGEVSTANLAAALQVPGVTRIGHATHAVHDARLLDLLAKSQVTVECPLTCNVIMGAAPSYAEHPIRRFVSEGIPVVLCTDDPVQVGTTIGREYAIAHALGFSAGELLAMTRQAVRVAFMAPARRDVLLSDLDSAATG
jgi:adenosine deaminase